jgi:hypothetical protein
MNKQKTLTIAVVILVMMNIATLSFIWISENPEHQHRRKKSRPNVERYLTHKLDLTTAQAAAFKTARGKHFEQTHDLMRSLRDDRQLLSQMLSHVDTTKQGEVMQRISEKNTELERLNFIHLQNLRLLCTDEQKQKFDSIIFKVIDKGAGNRKGKRRHNNKK